MILAFLSLFYYRYSFKKFVRKNFDDKSFVAAELCSLLTNKELSKLKNEIQLIYLAILQPFLMLLGRKATTKEKLDLILLSTYALVHDGMLDNPSRQSGEKENLLEKLKLLLHERMVNKELFEFYSQKSLEAQYESQKQFEPEITLEQIRKITSEKCGFGFLLIRNILRENIQEDEKLAIFQYGGTAQIGDDIIDLYDDISNKIHTLANRIPLVELSEMYRHEVATTISNFSQLPYPRKNIRKATMRITIFLSVFQVALNRYKKLSICTHDWEIVLAQPRNLFITDMEKWKEKIQLFVISFRNFYRNFQYLLN